MIVKIRNLVLLCCAWCLCQSARADFEIETFTRYRIDNFDNNNNGYANVTNDGEEFGSVETIAIAKGLDSAGGLGPFLWQAWTPPTNTRSGLSNTSSRFSDISSGLIDISPGFSDLPNDVAPDFDDLVTINYSAERMEGYSYMQSRSFLLEKVLRFSPKKPDQPSAGEESVHIWEVSYGARFLQLDDSYRFLASGGVLGATNITNAIDNQQIGPHVGVKWSRIEGPWNVSISGIAQAGLGTTDTAQTGAIGMDLNPGAVNSPIFAQPNTTNDEDYDEFASYYGEIRAQISRTLTDQLSLNVGCSGYYFGNLKYADDSINWSLPNFGITDNGTQDTFVSTAFANLEFRR